MKYVVFTNEEVGERPILFPEWMEHKVMAKAMERQLDINPRSAGFVKFDIDGDYHVKPVCYGESKSLDLKPHEDDEKIIELMIRR